MSFWIEIRCENRAEKSAEGDANQYPHHRCWSHENEGPMQDAGDTQAAVLSAYRDLEDDARKSGWVKSREGWFCPFCVAARAQENSNE